MEVDVLRGEVEEIDRFGLDLPTVADILQENAWWVVSQQELFEFHLEFVYFKCNT